MVDLVKLVVKAGDGGDGTASFQRTKWKPQGPPNGGDGGKGGDIHLISSEDVHTLLDFHYKSHFEAASGNRGGSNHKKGESGADLFLKVPMGTVVQGLSELTKAGQTLLVARGGRGGHGNAHFKRSQLPDNVSRQQYYQELKLAEHGEKGEERQLTLELKLIADIGIIGLPNSGKSTLLSVLTSAHPKIADYPFTTLEPNLGVMQYGGASLVLADIPGLIEGASEGKGLGLDFLRHIERTRILVHLVSAEVGDFKSSYQTIRQELGSYSEELLEKEEIIVVNKIDILSDTQRKERGQTLKALKKPYCMISAVTGEGIEELKQKLVNDTIYKTGR